MDQRPNNYNDQGPNGQGPNGNGGPGGPKNKSSLLVLLICVLATLLIWTVFSNILQSSTSMINFWRCWIKEKSNQ